jgi:poly-gamma-glutamate capsule biosynthesis protein CapA/YwtB (metallophosphatase superfamily)
MVAKIPGRQKKRNSGPGRSLRFGLLIVALFSTGIGWADAPEFKIGFVGDILPDRGVKSVIQRNGLAGLFKNTSELFKDTDLVCANLEAAVTQGNQPLMKTFHFNSPLNIGEYLAQNKITLVTLANNHSIDFGKAGLSDTVSNLKRYQVEAFGYGPNAWTALAPKIIDIRGTRIAFIGAVCFPLEGYVYLPDAFDVGRWDASLVKLQIQAARQQADIVVICLHWGIEFSHYPTSSQMEIAHFCIDQGADLVIGHHPHVMQGMELYQHKPIFYSLGNFIFDQHYGPTTQSIFANITISEKRIRRIELLPVLIHDFVPGMADQETAAVINKNFLKYSEPFNLNLFQPEGKKLSFLL